MTREEAIAVLHDMKDTYDEIHENTNYEIGYEQMTALDMAIKALSADSYSRDEFIKAFDAAWPHAEWIKTESDEPCEFRCSMCAGLTDEPSDFCPRCGADMRGE